MTAGDWVRRTGQWQLGSIQGSLSPSLREEEQIKPGGEDDAGYGDEIVIEQADGDTPSRHPLTENVGPIDGVDGERAGLVGIERVTGLLGEDIGLGIVRGDALIEEILDLTVGLGHDGLICLVVPVGEAEITLFLEGQRAGCLDVVQNVLD
jgi:hypothetical protein